MEDIIKELETILNRLLKQQDDDIISDAIKQSSFNVAKKDTSISEDARRIYDKKMYKNPKKTIFATKEKEQEFLEDLKENYHELYKRSLDNVILNNTKRAEVIAVLIDFIKLLKEDLQREILDFETLRETFDYINLSPNTELAIFVHLIKSNAFLHRLIGMPIKEANFEALIEYNFKYLTKKEVNDIIMHIGIDIFLSDSYDAPEKAKLELLEAYNKTSIDYSKRQELIAKLDELFSKKTSDLTEDDFANIKDIMDKLLFGKLSHRVIKQMRKMKESAIKESTDLVSTVTKTVNKNKVEKPKPKHSKKEINQVHYEISKLYDLEHFKSKTVLSLDEIIYLLSLMYKIEIKESTILKFLESVTREYRKNNPICIFYQSYDKFKSYDNEEINEHLEMLEYILTDTNIFICSDDEYEETKELVSIEINAIMDILSGNYDYEINKAKSLLKVSKEGEM